MGFRFQDLDGAALTVAAVVGLLTIIAPLANLAIRSLKDLQFGRPGLFAAMAEVVSLGSFLTVLSYRHSLHHLPAFWILFVLFVLLAASLIPLHVIHGKYGSDSLRATACSVLGLLVYVSAASLLAFSLTQFSAQHLMFLRVYGSVRDPQGVPLNNIDVFCTNGAATIQTSTDSKGDYVFLLTEREALALNELRVGHNERSTTKSWAFMLLHEDSFPYSQDFTWIP